MIVVNMRWLTYSYWITIIFILHGLLFFCALSKVSTKYVGYLTYLTFQHAENPTWKVIFINEKLQDLILLNQQVNVLLRFQKNNNWSQQLVALHHEGEYLFVEDFNWVLPTTIYLPAEIIYGIEPLYQYLWRNIF